MSSSFRDKALEGLSFEYDPKKIEKKRGTWKWRIIGAVISFILGVASTIGVIKSCGATLSVNDHITQIDNKDLVIAEVLDKDILVIDKSDPLSTEIRVASITTNTINLTPPTHLSSQLLVTALAPQKDRFVYLQEEVGHRAAIVIDLTDNSRKIIDRNKLRTATGDIPIEPCSWSPVAWSLDSMRFSFFGCTRNTSVLVVIEAETELTPVVLTKTEAPQTPPRQIFWLNDKNLLYTSFDPSTKRTKVSQIDIDPNSNPLPVYPP